MTPDKRTSFSNPLLVRVFACVGLAVTSLTVWIGIWPSIFTVLALAVGPALVLFAVTLFVPRVALRWRRIRIYLIGSAVASAAFLLYQFLSLALGGGNWIPPWR